MIKNIHHPIFQYIVILLTVFASEFASAQVQQNIISSSKKSVVLTNWQITKDPAPKDALISPEDSLWVLFAPSLESSKYSEGNWILRTEIVIADSISSNTVIGIFPIGYMAAYEIYWDGAKIAQNGIIGINNSDEIAGSFNFQLSLTPQQVTKGKHIIVLRLSNYHSHNPWEWFYGAIIIGPFNALLKNIFKLNYQAFFTIGILFIPFLFNLFLYIARKRRTEHLLFSLICFIVIMDSVVSLIPVFINTQTTFIQLQYFSYRVFTIITAILFPAYFIFMFSFAKKIIGLIVAVNLIIFFMLHNINEIFNVMSLTVLIESSIITGWALLKRCEGSIIILIGLIVAWVAYLFNLAFAGLAAIMVICTSFSIARQFARKEKSEREAQLRSANLENQLLKKNINSHFLLNTLTSIIVWLRKDPKSAIKLIETLAEEFRMVTQISSLKQISIKQEIDLCRAHLDIMNFRRGSDYKMETVDIIEEESVPPMIFHTLLENGLTHGYENKTNGTFTLLRRKNTDSVEYIFSNDGDFSNEDTKGSNGFGNKYIASRLEESYPDRWKFSSNKKEGGWETIIEIKDK